MLNYFPIWQFGISVYYTPTWALKRVLSWIIKLDIATVARKQAEDNNDRKLSEKMGATESDRIIILVKKG